MKKLIKIVGNLFGIVNWDIINHEINLGGIYSLLENEGEYIVV